ncbi:hypothetical protein KOY_03369 [Bacillus cereus VDM021]|nr:hypothetical protein IIW_01699 [Bacillus cereus VD136]EOP73646.1 hypothetical protein KOW_01056 [Bacillus cereus VDM006]EOQ07145.1 hypothetical protein KOY_03369 [Bacillus cereus VDM021]
MMTCCKQGLELLVDMQYRGNKRMIVSGSIIRWVNK